MGLNTWPSGHFEAFCLLLCMESEARCLAWPTGSSWGYGSRRLEPGEHGHQLWLVLGSVVVVLTADGQAKDLGVSRVACSEHRDGSLVAGQRRCVRAARVRDRARDRRDLLGIDADEPLVAGTLRGWCQRPQAPHLLLVEPVASL